MGQRPPDVISRKCRIHVGAFMAPSPALVPLGVNNSQFPNESFQPQIEPYRSTIMTTSDMACIKPVFSMPPLSTLSAPIEYTT